MLSLVQFYEFIREYHERDNRLLDGNSLIQNKKIVAHVLAHCDFFKNNMRFSMSNRDMVESMSATADRIAGYSVTYGTEAVESFIDSVLAIQEHIDPSLIQPRKLGKTHLLEAKMKERKDTPPGSTRPNIPYNELWDLDKTNVDPQESENAGKQAFRPEPEKDIV